MYNQSMNPTYPHLAETLDALPASPGVYQMKSESGKILYIGKAKMLKNRVRSYFQESATHTPRIAVMVSKVASIEILVTASEMEALVLEDNLIKKEQPPYNVLLKDDKNYPYLKFTMNETYPRLILVRKVEKDGGVYFGPYVSGKAVRGTLRLIHKIFPLRQSRDSLDGKPLRRPCLNHQMGRCLAPCAGKTTQAAYREMVDEVVYFLKGKSERLIETLTTRMWEASTKEKFEEAAKVRDQIAAIETLFERQRVSLTRMAEEDVIAAVENAGKAIIKIFQIRGGKMNGDRWFVFDRLDKLDLPEALAAFIRQFYSGPMAVPQAVIVSEHPEGVEPLTERLSLLRGGKVSIVTPQRGERKKLLDMAVANAQLQLATLVDSNEGRSRGLEEVAQRLGLEELPRVIEGYDISHSQGVASVGSVVCFVDGVADKKEYRKYKVRTVTGPDDYASMAEVITRRFKRLDEEGKEFPDLLVIDGGKGQVTAVVRSFELIGVDPPPIVGIAKGGDRENVATDQFYRPGETVPTYFPESSAGRFLLQRVRDESHRFAVEYHKKLRDGVITRSSLDAIEGIGPKRKKALLKKFGSVKGLREATVDETAATLKVSMTVAQKIHEQL
jgi:excinuclease ABC subunit C